MVGVDATYLRADASMKAIVRKGSGEGYKGYLRELAREAGVEQPTDEDLRRLERKRKGKKKSNEECESPTDPALFGVGTPREAVNCLKVLFALFRTLVLWAHSCRIPSPKALHRGGWHSPSPLTALALGRQARTSTGC